MDTIAVDAWLGVVFCWWETTVSGGYLVVSLSGLDQAGAKLGGGFTVAKEAEGADVVEVALTSAFGYGADVVGVP